MKACWGSDHPTVERSSMTGSSREKTVWNIYSKPVAASKRIIQRTVDFITCVNISCLWLLTTSGSNSWTVLSPRKVDTPFLFIKSWNTFEAKQNSAQIEKFSNSIVFYVPLALKKALLKHSIPGKFAIYSVTVGKTLTNRIAGSGADESADLNGQILSCYRDSWYLSQIWLRRSDNMRYVDGMVSSWLAALWPMY